MESGTISALKHFPGHGDTNADSHTGLPRIGKTYDELKANELIPFQACIDAGAEAIMTAHIQYPAIETETYVSRDSGEEITLPATLSRTILTGILRGDMGFDGVILTDAMEMDAIAKNFDPMDAACLAIQAGVDILLMPVDPGSMTDREGLAKLDRYIADLAALTDNGTIPMERVDESVLRILALKEKHGLPDAYDGSKLDGRVANALATVGSAEHHATEWEIARRADGSFDPYARVTRGEAAEYLRAMAGGSGAADDLLTGDMEAVITREAFVAALYAFAKNQNRDVSVGEDTNILSYDDAFDVSEYAIPAMQWACGAGVINGTSENALSPGAEMTRAQMAVMLLRYGKAS